MYKIYGDNDVFLYQVEIKPTIMRDYEQYYIGDSDEKIINQTYNEDNGKLYIDDRGKELKKQAPHEDKIDTTHKNYDYSYARSNADDGYFSLEEQLDMKYWDVINSTTTWLDHIADVKNKYPKLSL